jgi:hypothetical protein
MSVADLARRFHVSPKAMESKIGRLGIHKRGGEQSLVPQRHDVTSLWGPPGSCPLPESLRYMWKGEKLPGWVRIALGGTALNLPAGATIGDLPRMTTDGHDEGSLKALQTFVFNLLCTRTNEIRPIKIWGDLWLDGSRLEDLELRTRTRNALLPWMRTLDTETGSADVIRALTYGDAYKMRNMGHISVLDLAVAGDHGFASSVQTKIQVESSLARLQEIIPKPWHNLVSSSDPRFTSLMPTNRLGTIAELLEEAPEHGTASSLADAFPQIEAQVSRIDGMRVEGILRHLAKHLLGPKTTYSDARLEAILARLGWTGEPTITLEEAGVRVGVTRERIRQITSKMLSRLSDAPMLVPALDRAVTILAAHAPLSLSEASALLVEENITEGPFMAENIITIAAQFELALTIQVVEYNGSRARNGVKQLVTHSHAEKLSIYADKILRIARVQAGAAGATNFAEVAAEVSESQPGVSEETVREVLDLFGTMENLVGDWFWDPGGPVSRNRLRNVTRKMLSVVTPIDVALIKEGVRRHYRYRGKRGTSDWTLVVPPQRVLKAYYESHPEFIVDDEDISCVMPLDSTAELDKVERTFVEVLRARPSCVMDRASLFEGCVDRGMKSNTFSVFCTYSPVVAHLGWDTWTLRGVKVSPEAVAVLQERRGGPEKRVLDHGWEENGEVWVATRLPQTWNSLVIGIPAGIRRFLVDREFETFAEGGVLVGRICVDSKGTSWGYGPFLRRAGADTGEIMVVHFDIVEGVARVRLEADEYLKTRTDS